MGCRVRCGCGSVAERPAEREWADPARCCRGEGYRRSSLRECWTITEAHTWSRSDTNRLTRARFGTASICDSDLLARFGRRGTVSETCCQSGERVANRDGLLRGYCLLWRPVILDSKNDSVCSS